LAKGSCFEISIVLSEGYVTDGVGYDGGMVKRLGSGGWRMRGIREICQHREVGGWKVPLLLTPVLDRRVRWTLRRPDSLLLSQV